MKWTHQLFKDLKVVPFFVFVFFFTLENDIAFSYVFVVTIDKDMFYVYMFTRLSLIHM